MNHFHDQVGRAVVVIYTEQWQIATCVWEQRAENNHYSTKISVMGEFPLRERPSSPQMKFACTLEIYKPFKTVK